MIVSRLFYNKGIQDTLEAIKDIDLKYWHIDIVGDGPYMKKLTDLSLKNKLQDKITFHGWIDNTSEQMKQLYGQAAIFISASHFESFGQTVLEAISAGCYPLISNIQSHKSIISDDKYFFDYKNSSSIKKRLVPLLNSIPSPKNISIKDFSWEKINLLYENQLKAILKKH